MPRAAARKRAPPLRYDPLAVPIMALPNEILAKILSQTPHHRVRSVCRLFRDLRPAPLRVDLCRDMGHAVAKLVRAAAIELLALRKHKVITAREAAALRAVCASEIRSAADLKRVCRDNDIVFFAKLIPYASPADYTDCHTLVWMSTRGFTKEIAIKVPLPVKGVPDGLLSPLTYRDYQFLRIARQYVFRHNNASSGVVSTLLSAIKRITSDGYEPCACLPRRLAATMRDLLCDGPRD